MHYCLVIKSINKLLTWNHAWQSLSLQKKDGWWSSKRDQHRKVCYSEYRVNPAMRPIQRLESNPEPIDWLLSVQPLEPTALTDKVDFKKIYNMLTFLMISD